jgi:hypothetical protein
MAKPKFEALSLPPDAMEKGGVEILRASIVDGGVSVALRRSFDDPFTWGVLLVDLARHAARIYALEAGMSEDEAGRNPKRHRNGIVPPDRPRLDASG